MPNTAQNPDELFDVVDKNDCVVGQAARAEVHRLGLFHRAVHIFVFDAVGNMILQKRALAKDTAPGLLSTSCAGHVDSGENYDSSAIRELEEELGISEEAAKNLHFLFAMSPCRELGWEFIRVYRLNYAGTLKPNPAEIDSLATFSPENIDREIRERPEIFAESFRLVWKNFRESEKPKNSPLP